ncbi:hypothetical protein COCCADRAFT_107523 [Bipolaris zeicola 26-R-13]|uniref:Pentatricopeptide repeat-containing protein-mitochondrial domain-containing protein n=1 Tax=Cochliobolus carbonum (strain 26-R-13) TaxID=930089 RepID=W6YD17_COCC2|nr:uncharacterized protein COCCADRAFT_107523 [Bipolaris zeicola 26-R-13]EUC29056.1 hypothetical protein COCCADRAFT_107523 [Bipolaris zeicola 26-R-13]
MPPRPFVNDRLWRCLCPGFPPNSTTSATVATSARRPQRNATRNDGSINPRNQWRAYTLSKTCRAANESFFSQPGVAPTGFRPFGEQSHVPRPVSSRQKPSLAQLPTDLLYDHARAEGAKGHWNEVMNICRVLIKDRGEQPNREMYTAILHSFVSSKDGTAGKLRKVLEEMGFWSQTDASLFGAPRIELDARACECVLAVLAVHPDYLLRSEILEYMKSRWLTLSTRGQNFVVAGLLRERHFEQALDTMEDMIRNNIRVENWVFDEAMWILLEFKEVEEAFYVLGLKETVQNKGSGTGTAKVSDALLGTLLDAAAESQLYEETVKVWMTQVQPGYLKPGTGTCMSVLALASHHGDVELATDVFRLLTERETTFTTHHYELIMSTHLQANDVEAALSVILIMVDANVKVDAATCQPLYHYLSIDTDDGTNRPLEAFALLQDYEAAGRRVPTAAVNACIQASLALGRLEEAIEIYKALHTVSRAGPNTNTFNILFKGCHKFVRKELAMFLANEMMQLGLMPDRITYDRLVLVCLRCGDLEDALLYYEEMMSSGEGDAPMKPRKKTWELLIHACVVKGDERAVALLNEYKREIDEPRMSVEKAVVDRFEYGMLPTPRASGAGGIESGRLHGVEDQHVRPAAEVTQSPGLGADTGRSGAKDGFWHQGNEAGANTEADLKESADLEGAQSTAAASDDTRPS